MKQFLWSIPSIGVYVYILTVVSMHGYASHFGIPASFIESSLRANIIYFFAQFKEFWIIAGNISVVSWLMISGTLLVALALLLFVLYLLQGSRFVFKSVQFLGILAVFILVIIGFNKLGSIRATNQFAFFVPSKECGYEHSVVPIIYDGEAIFVPIDADNKMSGGFFVKKISEMNCKLIPEIVGLIKS